MKRSLVFTILIALIIAAAAGTAYLRSAPGVDARELVSKALLHHGSGRYVADIVTTTGHINQTLRTSAKLYHDGENERINQGDVWALTRGRTTYTCLPHKDTMLVGITDNKLSDKDRVRLVLRNYRISVEGSEQLAGRTAYITYLQPRSGDGPSKRLWIDRERFVVLKSVDYSATGGRRAQMQITRIKFDAPIDQSIFKIPSRTARHQITVSEPAEPKSVGRRLNILIGNPADLPSGYVLEGAYFYRCQCNCGHRALLTTYTDGLNTISVFQSPSDVSCNARACKEGGHSCVVQESEIAKLGQVEKNGRTIVVVADLLPDDIRKITASIR